MRRVEVLVHDQRGLGRTEIPPGPYSMRDYAADALALMDEVGWSSCVVIGVSFGGMVAQEFAVTNPDRVDRLCSPARHPGGRVVLPVLCTISVGVRPDAGRAHAGVARHPLQSRIPGWTSRRPGRVDVAARPGGEQEQHRGEREQLLARRDHNVMDRLPNITCPTLVAAGRYDGIAPLANSEAIVSRIPDSELRVYEGGHIFFVQDQRAIPETLDFLDLV